jgi:hypothetical protein
MSTRTTGTLEVHLPTARWGLPEYAPLNEQPVNQKARKNRSNHRGPAGQR